MRKIGRRIAAWIAAIAILFAFEAHIPVYAEENGMVRVWLTRFGANPTITIRPTCDYYLADMPLRRVSAGKSATFTNNGGTISMTVGDSTVYLSGTARLNRSRAGKEGIVFQSPSDANRYCGDLILVANGTGISIVLDIFVEDYLYGVVGYEMSPSDSLEALKAQAIVARNYALRHRRDRTKYAYDLTDNSTNQTFKGLSSSSRFANVLRAVDETRGQTLYYGNSLANCYYGASNGGQTESTKNAWGGTLAYSVVRDDPYDYAGKGKLKTATIRGDAKNLNAQLEQALISGVSQKAANNGVSVEEVRIESIDSIALTDARFAAPSRLYQTAVFTVTAAVRNQEGVYATRTCEVRVPVYGGLESWYGLSINSGKNETVWVESDGNTFTIRMGRNGHGVGMSQTGAQVMAKNYGMTASEILDFYYPGCRIQAIALSDSTADAATPNAIALARTGAECALYESADMNANVIATIDAGETVQIYASAGEWAAVGCGNTAGYILASGISECVPMGETMQREDNLIAVVSDSNISLKYLPIESSGTIAKLNREAVVSVYFYTENWAAVLTADGLRGYVRLNALSRQTEPTPTPTPTDEIHEISGEWYARVIQNRVNLSSSPSANAEAIEVLSMGASVRIYAHTSEWAAVETAAGNRGFVPLSSITLQPQTTETPQPEVKTLSGTWYVRATENVYLRSGPRADGDIQETILKGAIARIYAYTSEWAALETAAGNRGYAPIRSLRLIAAPNQEGEKVYTIHGERYAEVTAHEIVIRESASNDADIVATLQKGTTVRAYAYTSKWVSVETSLGQKGYIAIGALKLLPEVKNEPEGGAVQAVRGTVYRYVSEASAKMYASCSASSAVVDRLAYGTRVQIGAYNSVWACVKANGQYGFVRISALSAKSPVASSAQDVILVECSAEAVRNAYAYARPDASAGAIGVFPKGQRVTVYAYNNAYAYVRAGKYSGFVALADLRVVV